MKIEDLIRQLNHYPMWTQIGGMDASQRGAFFATVKALSDAFESGGMELRTLITSSLTRPAKYMLYQYTWDRACEARRSGSRATILEGLIPVVMAGGRADRPTAGGLLAVLLRAGEATGQNVTDLFTYAGDLSTNEEARSLVRSFPSQRPEQRNIERFGFHEIRTKAGVAYETPEARMSRPRWWDRIAGKRRVSREDVLDTMRAIEAYYPEWNDSKD